MGTPDTLFALRERHAKRPIRYSVDSNGLVQGRLVDAAGKRTGKLRRPATVRSGQAYATLAEVAATLPQPFSLEQLVVAAWKAAPELFGLPGMEADYPSDKRTCNTLYGARGLIRRGKLRRVAGGFAVREGKP